MCVDALSSFRALGWRLARSLNNRFSFGGWANVEVDSAFVFAKAQYDVRSGGENTIYAPTRRAHGRERKLNNYPHRVYCTCGFSRLHDCPFGNDCDRNSGFVSHNLQITSRVRYLRVQTRNGNQTFMQGCK
jgi:hypothetical protein